MTIRASVTSLTLNGFSPKGPYCKKGCLPDSCAASRTLKGEGSSNMGYVVPQLQGHREKWWLPWVVILGLFVAIAASIPFCQQDHRGEDNWETYSHQLQRLDIGDQFPFPPDPIAHVEAWRTTKEDRKSTRLNS